jgi:hypothetical protein
VTEQKTVPTIRVDLSLLERLYLYIHRMTTQEKFDKTEQHGWPAIRSKNESWDPAKENPEITEIMNRRAYARTLVPFGILDLDSGRRNGFLSVRQV